MFKILNLYAGIGGNRKLWDKSLKEKFGNDYQITAIEYNEEIAAIYKDFFPNDEVIVTDAHQYLLEHFKEFDFIWSSPPCPSHSITNYFLHAQGIIRYPDMSLYQEIIFLKYWFKGKYIVENVKSYYNPLIEPQKSGRHYFWANFKIPYLKYKKDIGRLGKLKDGSYGKSLTFKDYDIDESKIKNVNKEKVLNNCVIPEIGLHILNRVLEIKESENVTQKTIFDYIK